MNNNSGAISRRAVSDNRMRMIGDKKKIRVVRHGEKNRALLFIFLYNTLFIIAFENCHVKQIVTIVSELIAADFTIKYIRRR